MDKFYVKKESNTFSDGIEALGLASIINNIFDQVSPDDKPDILIEDKGFCYQISLSSPIEDEMIDKCRYFDILPYIANKNDDVKKISHSFIDYENEKKIRDNYNDPTTQQKKDIPYPVRPDYDIIRMFANMEGYKKSFHNCREFENHFPEFLKFLLKFYSLIDEDLTKYEKELKEFLNENEIKPSKINALQDINPDKGKGVNQPKANGINPKGQNDFWLQQLVRFKGAWSSFVSRYFDKDIKTYSLVPRKISFDVLNSVFKRFKPLVKGKDSIKMDILLIQLLTKELIKHDVNFKNNGFFISPKDKISGFQMAYYKNLGQRPAVTNIGFLGLPDFIKFRSEAEGLDWIDLLEEHQDVISAIKSNSSNISMLQKYRQFISASDFESFFEFCYEYGQFLISSISDKKYFIKPFSIKKLEVLMKTKYDYQEILSNSGFQAVASAIRNSTIVPIIHKNKKDVVFGLSQKFKIASRDKDSLASEVSEFINQYNESVMLKDYHQKQHHKYVTTEELREFFKLLDGDNSSKLIAGMLIAFGYAKDPSKEIENQEVQND